MIKLTTLKKHKKRYRQITLFVICGAGAPLATF